MNRKERLLSASLRDLLKLAARPYLIRPYFRRQEQVEFVASVTGESPEALRLLEREFFGKHEFRTRLNQSLIEKRGVILGLNAITGAGFYMLIRVLRPAVMVETGVFDGINTAVMLLAMHDNRHGRLTSIDLPATGQIHDSTRGMPSGRLPPGCLPGWIIPDELRDRHELHLGDSREILPRVLEEKKVLDIFMHDSLHTDAHMTFEFEAAWPRIRDGGLLLSDDIVAWGARNSFMRFCRRQGVDYRAWGALGAAVKPGGPRRGAAAGGTAGGASAGSGG